MTPAQKKKSVDNELREAALTLADSDRGRDALAALLEWINDHGLGLDADNQEAVIDLLVIGVWGPTPGTTRDMIQEVLSTWP